jgi:hypothetical protein
MFDPEGFTQFLKKIANKDICSTSRPTELQDTLQGRQKTVPLSRSFTMTVMLSSLAIGLLCAWRKRTMFDPEGFTQFLKKIANKDICSTSRPTENFSRDAKRQFHSQDPSL